ncbi:MAG: hypothetical protein K2Y22_04385 [Candidatus Obscuribacterales bacterium]|nr:hypothetical protein [Candidatus Obscuribacterales bacterium]
MNELLDQILKVINIVLDVTITVVCFNFGARFDRNCTRNEATNRTIANELGELNDTLNEMMEETVDGLR